MTSRVPGSMVVRDFGCGRVPSLITISAAPPGPPPSTPWAGCSRRSDSSESRSGAGDRTSITASCPSPPRNCPAPPLSGRSCLAQTTRGATLSKASMLPAPALVGKAVVASPSRCGLAPMPPEANSTWLKRSPCRSRPENSARMVGAPPHSAMTWPGMTGLIAW